MVVYVFDQEWGGPWTEAPGTIPPFAVVHVQESEGPAIEVTPDGYTIDDATWRKHQRSR